MFDVNNPNHRLNCVKVCLQGHAGSPVTSVNFHKNLLLSGSENGLLVLWDLYNNQVFRVPRQVENGVALTEFVNEKCFLAVSGGFKVYVFQKTETPNRLLQPSPTEFKCFRFIDLGVPIKADAPMSSCIYGKELLLGTRKGRLIMVDMVRVCEKFGLKLQDYFSDISGHPLLET